LGEGGTRIEGGSEERARKVLSLGPKVYWRTKKTIRNPQKIQVGLKERTPARKMGTSGGKAATGGY